MDPSEFERYLHEHIPLSKAMAVAVLELGEEGVLIGAPLAPNINHRATVFGGSASAVAILAAWSLLHLRLSTAGIASRVVIQRNTMDYEQPIAGNFSARATLAEPHKWPQFLRLLARRGKARVAVNSVLEFEGRRFGHFSGDFVALGAETL